MAPKYVYIFANNYLIIERNTLNDLWDNSSLIWIKILKHNFFAIFNQNYLEFSIDILPHQRFEKFEWVENIQKHSLILRIL